MEYITKSHSKYLLMAHLIFSCKYRKKLLNKLGNDIKESMFKIADKYDFDIIEMEVAEDHIHVLISYAPTLSILDVVRHLKQQSTYHIWKKHESFLKKHFWKERTFWSDGYFSASVGNVSKSTIEKYISEQG